MSSAARCGCAGVVGGFADHVVGGFDLGAEGVGEALLDEADGEVGDVDADPAAVEALRDLDGGAAAAEGIENDVAFVGTGFDDAFEEGFGFLGGVAETLLGLGVDGRNVVPNVSRRATPGISSRYRLNCGALPSCSWNTSLPSASSLLHRLLGVSPIRSDEA